MRLRPLAEPLVAADHMAAFGALIGKAFAHRRKTLRNNLKGVLDAEQIAALDIDPGVRAESLTVQDLIRLHQAVDQSST